MRYISLFAGIGGFDLALNRLGHKCVYANEWDRWASKVYAKNFSANPDTRDITTIRASEIPDHDLLVGGFPCQAFSIAGKRRGFNETRGTLFFDIARILKSHQPMFVLLENVKGLVSHDGGKTLEVILDNLQDLGYYVNWEIYNSKDFGVPQNRERIFFLCRHYKGLISVGTNEKMTTYESLIQEYLFQLLLNNLTEVKKLQEIALKDWVVGYLLSKEMNQSQKLSEENTKDGIMIPTADGIFQLKVEEVWQNIDIWLSKRLGVGSRELNTSTILTVTKRIIESKTSTFSQMQELIWLATVVLRKLQPSLWQEVLLGLTLIEEDTKYARINNQKEKVIITETRNAHKSDELQNPERYFSLRHIRGEPRPKVFPVRESSEENTKQIINPLTNKTPYGWHFEQNVYSDEGILRSLKAGGGSGNMPKLLHNIYGGFKESKARVFEDISPTIPARAREDGSGQPILISKTVRAGGRKSPHGSKQNWDSYEIGNQIRRLTPLECERLQGFPDNWTEGVSDTQRYKQLGNAVTVNVVYEIAKKLTQTNP